MLLICRTASDMSERYSGLYLRQYRDWLVWQTPSGILPKGLEHCVPSQQPQSHSVCSAEGAVESVAGNSAGLEDASGGYCP